MPFNIVLVAPEIPNNTGNIGRLSLASGSVLHLVKPFGFELSDTRLKRAGLDYWKHLTVKTYESLEEFLEVHKDKKMVYLSSAAKQSYVSIDYVDDLFFVFGSLETQGPDAPVPQTAWPSHCKSQLFLDNYFMTGDSFSCCCHIFH